MKFKRLILENFKCYKYLDLQFNDGVTIISGSNGSGKSSILEACSIALFGGSGANNNYQISDIITKGQIKTTIILFFEHLNNEYKIEQEFKKNKNNQASNSKSILYNYNGESIVEQSKKTYEYILNLINMDEKSYESCIYIKQGDIDSLINSKPKERQKIIDDLLQIGKIEEYLERLNICRNSIVKIHKNISEKYYDLKNKTNYISSKNLPNLMNIKKQQIYKIDNEIKSNTDNNTSLIKQITMITRVKDEYTKKIEEVEKYNESIKKTIISHDNIKKEISNIKQEIEKIEKDYKTNNSQKIEIINKLIYNIKEIDVEKYRLFIYIVNKNIKYEINEKSGEYKNIINNTQLILSDINNLNITKTFFELLNNDFIKIEIYLSNQITQIEQEILYLIQNINEYKNEVEVLKKQIIELHHETNIDDKKIIQFQLKINNNVSKFENEILETISNISYLNKSKNNIIKYLKSDNLIYLLKLVKILKENKITDFKLIEIEQKKTQIIKNNLYIKYKKFIFSIQELSNLINKNKNDIKEKYILRNNLYSLKFEKICEIQNLEIQIEKIKTKINKQNISISINDININSLYKYENKIQLNIETNTNKKKEILKQLNQFNNISSNMSCPFCNQELSDNKIDIIKLEKEKELNTINKKNDNETKKHNLVKSIISNIEIINNL